MNKDKPEEGAEGHFHQREKKGWFGVWNYSKSDDAGT